MKRRAEMVELILNFIIIIAQLIVIYMFIDFLFGNSPDLIDLIGSLVVALVVNAFRVQGNLGNLNGKFEVFSHNVKGNFIRVREDIQEVKGDIKENTKELGEIKKLLMKKQGE